ncbi:hypothetical protein [Amycolatopsis solani]|uniref:hypothetical protein n=1 Tax=Amycolatopsis solani TaxID=3028615 RepID=UPI0025B10177|nr:hypothetical protein [Amycolatopsis sp. MEP2-6]
MLLNILTAALPGVAVPAFSYLKYRAYLKTVRHVVDNLGGDGLDKLDMVLPPSGPIRHSPSHRRQSSSR